MKRHSEHTDKRLIGALDHIDDRFVAEAANKIKERPVAGTAVRFNKMRSFKQIAILAACLLLMGAAIPLAANLIGRLPDMLAGAGSGEPDTTEAPEETIPDEYFSTGNVVSYGSAGAGIEYEGSWIFVEHLNSGGDRIAKYDPETKESSSVCLDTECDHSSMYCPLFLPSKWMLNYIDAFGDWLMYEKSTQNGSNYGPNGKRLGIYNMKTGESRVISEKTEENGSIKYPGGALLMDGKVYYTVNEIDVTDPKNPTYKNASIMSYDPVTDEAVFMFEEPEDLNFIGITNKRIIFTGYRRGLFDPANIWTTDYRGGELKKESVLDFDTVMLCGTYAYSAVESDYAKDGCNTRVYDLTSDTIKKIDLGTPISSIFVGSGVIGYVTKSNIDEYKEYVSHKTAYIMKLYPEMTEADINTAWYDSIKEKLDGEIKHKGTTYLYLTDALGENKQLIFEGENMNMSLRCKVGDYIMASIEYADPNDGYKITEKGYYAINVKTGELSAVPAVNNP